MSEVKLFRLKIDTEICFLSTDDEAQEKAEKFTKEEFKNNSSYYFDSENICKITSAEDIPDDYKYNPVYHDFVLLDQNFSCVDYFEKSYLLDNLSEDEEVAIYEKLKKKFGI